MDNMQIAVTVILIIVGFSIQIAALYSIKDELAKGFWWNQQWLKQEKKYKTRIYELETKLDEKATTHD